MNEQNTGIRYKSWDFDKNTGALKVTFENGEILKAVAEEMLEFLKNHPEALTGEMYIIFTHEPKKENG